MRYHRAVFAGLTGLWLLAVAGCERRPFAGPPEAKEIRPGEPVFGLAPGPPHDDRGYQLILDFEVGGGKAYYDKLLSRPMWPKYASGVTWGVGYDGGYSARSVILTDWHRVPYGNRERLADTSGITGKAAKPVAAGLRDIVIPWPHAEEVFQRVTISRYWEQTRRAFPGVEKLCPEAQWALLSLVYNRGPGMSGARRAEMREIRAAVARGDIKSAARANRASVRVWAGSEIERGMRRRRNAEAALMESCLDFRFSTIDQPFPIRYAPRERQWTIYPVITATAGAEAGQYVATAELRGSFKFFDFTSL